MKNINNKMKSVGKQSRECFTCGKVKYHAPFYNWISLDNESLGLICQQCALREVFGSKYKTNKKYKEWTDG